MRHLSSLFAPRTPARRPSNARDDRQAEKRTNEPKPAPKRCLNEAAHKLGR